ncbi:LppU/SCO3897 family protein [Kitasatospora sp. McL0602]|uniref:LppU/SCO3897 family protein n=1 Tax=Kitasatospora sp. McL0602 TaxID=3439530 RepID=UPI003F8A899D
MTTPPPGYGYGQPQMGPPSGPMFTPQQGPQAQQPGFGMPPGQPYGQLYSPPTPPAEEKKKPAWRTRLFLTILIGVPVALGGFGIWAFLFGGSEGPLTGNCVVYQAAPGTKATEPKVVRCSSPTANAIVIKRYDHFSTLQSCDKVPGTIGSYHGNYRSKGKRYNYLDCFGTHTPGK